MLGVAPKHLNGTWQMMIRSYTGLHHASGMRVVGAGRGAVQAADRARGPYKSAAHRAVLGAVVAAVSRGPRMRCVRLWGPPVEAEAAPVCPPAREPGRGTRGTWLRVPRPRPHLAGLRGPPGLAQQVLNLIEAAAVGEAPRALDLLRAGQRPLSAFHTLAHKSSHKLHSACMSLAGRMVRPCQCVDHNT